MERLLSVGTLLSRLGLASLAVCWLAWWGEESYQVSGVVMFDGKLVPAGKIYLIPDESKGNRGAPGYATIINGAYDTAAPGGKAAAGGPMIVGIEGIDPGAKTQRAPGDTSGEETFQALFPYYQTTSVLPEEHATVDFEVPVTAVDREFARWMDCGGIVPLSRISENPTPRPLSR